MVARHIVFQSVQCLILLQLLVVFTANDYRPSADCRSYQTLGKLYHASAIFAA